MNELSKDAVNWLTVGEDSAGQRIDNYLGKMLRGVPKSYIYRILRSGEVRVNKGRVNPGVRLAPGDIVRVPPVRTAPRTDAGRRPAQVRASVPVLFEDDALLALDKPAGLAVHGGSGIALGLIEQMRVERPDSRFLELVHRLDRGTSGVILLAKKRAALVAMHAELRAGNFEKRYLVLVRGKWRDPKRRVTFALHKFAAMGGERRVRVEDGGQAAETIFYRLRVWSHHVPPLALLEAELRTGRTHQIRVHLTYLEFPIAGDDKYGDFAWNRILHKQGLKRIFLHAHSLAFAHPVTGERIALSSPLAGDLSAFIARMDAEVTLETANA